MNLSDPRPILEQATAAANANEYLKAIQLYNDVLVATVPRSNDQQIREARLTALRERGRLFTLLGQPQAALASYEQYYAEADKSMHAVDALVAIGNQCAYMNMTDR